jgi:hypothetical protein
VTPQLNAYVYGYTRLYRPDTQTTVDIVYDVHKKTGLTHDEMEVGICDDIKQGLYPTEKVFVESLEKLNREHPNDTTIIWEHAPCLIYSGVHLLTYPDRLVKNRLRGIKFVSSDTWRLEYPSCILSILQGASLERRVNRNAIIQHSGYQVWERYQAHMKEVIDDLVLMHARDYDRIAHSCHNDETYRSLFFAKFPYAALADLEMLANILSSHHHHIIVFAGGAHGANIADFLRCYTPYQLVYSVVDRSAHEICPQELKHIAQPHIHASQGHPQKTRYYEEPVKNRPYHALRTNIAKPKKIAYQEGAVSSNEQGRNFYTVGALVLGAVVASAYFENRATPGSDFATIARRKLLTTLTYGAVPGFMYYVWMNKAQE